MRVRCHLPGVSRLLTKVELVLLGTYYILIALYLRLRNKSLRDLLPTGTIPFIHSDIYLL